MAQKFEVGERVTFPTLRDRDVGVVLAWFPLDHDYLITDEDGDSYFVKEEEIQLYEF
jgi:hypothetical protein